MPKFFLFEKFTVYLSFENSRFMTNKTNKIFIIRVLLHLVFILGIFYFFRNNSILRPLAKGAYYKEYLSAFFLLILLYANYLFFVPEFFQKRRYFLFFILALAGILGSSSMEMLLVLPNIKSCFPDTFDNFQLKLVYTHLFYLIGLRNTGFLLFFFVLRIFEHERETLEKERIALVKNKGIICVPNGKNIMETISISDISCILHERNYTYLYTNDGNRYCKYCSLSSMEKLLPEDLFLRVNRNTIIPLNKITHYTEDSVTILYGNPAQEKTFSLSENYVPIVKELLSSTGGLNRPDDGLNSQDDGLNNPSEDLNDGLNTACLEDFLNNVEHNEELLILCRMIAKNPSVTMKSLSDQLGVSLKTIERRIKILKDKGILQHSGAKKNGEYVFASSIPGSVINWLTTDELSTTN